MILICCLVYLSILVSGNILVQSIQEQNISHFVNTFTENEVRVINELKNIAINNSKSKWQQQGNITDYQVFINGLKTPLKLVKNVRKVVDTNSEENNDHARQSNLSKDWEQENRQERQVSMDDEVEMDETTNMTFSEKERKDGYKRTRAEDNPYAVLVLIEPIGDNQKVGKVSSCSGTLVTPLAVLTAAHCFDNKVDRVHVYAGGNSIHEINEIPSAAQLREVKSYYKHPDYKNRVTGEFDVAVVKVTKAFELTSTVKTMKIGKRQWTHDKYKACKLTGFGVVYLNESNPEDHTRKTHSVEVKIPCPCFPITEGALCTSFRADYGICGGDSGGGLVCEGVVVAVSSGLLHFPDINNCIWSNKPECGSNKTIALFQETGPYLEWINSKVNSASTGRSCLQILFMPLVTKLFYIKF